MLEEAIAHYHALLDDATAQATQHMLMQEQRARNLFFGDRPLVSVLRPRFFSHEQYAFLRQRVSLIAQAAQRLAQETFTNPSLLTDLMLTPQEQILIAMHSGYPEPSAHGRMDTFLTTDGQSLQFVEYNAESPAAIAYEDELSALFLQLPAMQSFAQHYRISSLPARHRLLETLLTAWSAFGSQRTPNIAILDWTGLPTHSEFILFQRYFHEHGIDAIICTPDDIYYRDGRLYARAGERLGSVQGDFPIDLVYKRILTSEFLVHYGDAALDHPLVHAYRDGKICLVNSFRAKLLHKKSIFAMLTDERYADYFSAEERHAIAQHVPWTRVVRPGETQYQGATIDLLAFIRSNRDRLLLKPNDEYGGKGIVIGWEVDQTTWEQAISDAISSPSVVQERVTIAYEDYPAIINGKLEIGQRLVDSDPFLFGGDVEGCLVRLSTVTLLNVTAGGGSTIPAFVIEPIGA